jgi:hypothetical protein
MEDSQKDTIILLNSKKLNVPALVKVVKRIQKEGDPLILIPETMQEALQVCMKTPCALILAPMQQKEDIREIANVINVARNSIKYNFIKVLVYNFMPHHSKLEETLMKKGVSEFIEVGLNEKSLMFKINLSFRAIRSNYKKYLESQENQDVKQFTGDIDYHKMILFKGPISECFDYWSIRTKKEFSFIKEQWEVEVTGPHDCLGKWEEVKKEGSPLKIWKWAFHKEIDPNLDGEGQWLFIGERPEYVSGRKAWMMISKTPALFFRAKDEISYKIHFDKKNVIVAKDSRMALENIKKIEQLAAALDYSFDQDKVHLMLKGEVINTYDKGTVENTDQVKGNLKGDLASGAETINTKLEGEIKRSDEIENNWQGQLKSGTKIDANLEGELNNSEEKSMGSSYEGESKGTDAFADLGRDNRVRPGGVKEENQETQWDGKIKSTDQVKGKLGTSENKRREFEEQNKDNKWDGVTKGTSKVAAHLTNPNKGQLGTANASMGDWEGDGVATDQFSNLKTSDQENLYQEEEKVGFLSGGLKKTDHIKDRPTDPRSKKRMLQSEGLLGGLKGEGGHADEFEDLSSPDIEGMSFEEGAKDGHYRGSKAKTDKLKNKLTDPRNRQRVLYKEGKKLSVKGEGSPAEILDKHMRKSAEDGGSQEGEIDNNWGGAKQTDELNNVWTDPKTGKKMTGVVPGQEPLAGEGSEADEIEKHIKSPEGGIDYKKLKEARWQKVKQAREQSEKELTEENADQESQHDDLFGEGNFTDYLDNKLRSKKDKNASIKLKKKKFKLLKKKDSVDPESMLEEELDAESDAEFEESNDEDESRPDLEAGMEDQKEDSDSETFHEDGETSFADGQDQEAEEENIGDEQGESYTALVKEIPKKDVKSKDPKGSYAKAAGELENRGDENNEDFSADDQGDKESSQVEKPTKDDLEYLENEVGDDDKNTSSPEGRAEKKKEQEEQAYWLKKKRKGKEYAEKGAQELSDVYKKIKEDKQKKKQAAIKKSEEEATADQEQTKRFHDAERKRKQAPPGDAEEGDLDDGHAEGNVPGEAEKGAEQSLFKQHLFDGQEEITDPDEMYRVNLFNGRPLPAAEKELKRKVANMELKLSVAMAPAQETDIMPDEAWKKGQICDFFDQCLILNIEGNFFDGTNYLVKVEIDYLEEVVNVVMKTKVIESQKMSEEESQVIFEIPREFIPVLERVRHVYERRQSNILSFMKIAKGG